MITERAFICADCVVDPYLKKYVERAICTTERCAICQETKKCIESTDKNAVLIVRSLIRFHYPEYVYNSHWGGFRDASFLLTNENAIIKTPKNYTTEDSEYEFEILVEDIVGGLDTENKVPLYSGSIDEIGRTLFPVSLKEKGSDIWNDYRSKLKKQNYYELINEFIRKIKPLMRECTTAIGPNITFFRARKGFVVVEIKDEDEDLLVKTYKAAYQGQQISAPLPLEAKPGRANRHGVSVLYVSSDKNIALAQVRPHPGHYVSIGQFVPKITLRVVDLRDFDLLRYANSERELDKFLFLLDLSKALSEPITPEEQHQYLVSQFVSDAVRLMEYNGILYNSAVSSGYNAVFFNPKDFRFVEDSAKLVRVLKQYYTIGIVKHVEDRFMERMDEIIETDAR